jgi:cysteinyl-tRNA synthetase
MTIKLYNSLTNQKETFVPITDGKVSFYACGQTVYDYCHIGHARTMTAFDVIVRHFRAMGYEVNYVRNITDIDDKIINRANENGESISELTERMIEIMHQDEQQLNLLPVDQEPRATAHIAEIIQLIERLIANDSAYIADNGDVCFAVKQFKDYGKLSNKDLEGQQSGARVDVVSEKRDPFDFVLWKKAKAGEPAWPSPWGEGRPGWHIECSAMSMNCLGETFDIHAGGMDLIFPHHENEIAQSEAASYNKFVNYWMHSGFLSINNEKMSKSLGNFFTIRDVIAQYNPEVVRYFLITSHYRSQLNYSLENLNAAKSALMRLYQAISEVERVADYQVDSDNAYIERYNKAMNDDFNTPEALSVLFDLAKEVNRAKGTPAAVEYAQVLFVLADRLGLLYQNPSEFLQGGEGDIDSSQIEKLIADRKQARADKDWVLADAIRDKLAQKGIEILDSADGTTWRKK